MVLHLEDIEVSYLKKKILYGLSMHIGENETVALIGANGSGKSTVLKAVAGLLQPKAGRLTLRNADMTNWTPRKRAHAGLGYLMQGGQVFEPLTVRENLELAAFLGRPDLGSIDTGIVRDTFPALMRRPDQRAGLLSGGERQMLAIGMVLVRRPDLLLLDEPSAGLAPALVEDILDSLRAYAKRIGASLLLVEQNIRMAVKLADRIYRLFEGKAYELPKESISTEEDILKVLALAPNR